jgi:Tol biopolymer transport system component
MPPGQRPVPPGQRPGPATQAHGASGRGPGGPGGYPPQAGDGGGPLGSRRNLILAIIGGVVLVAAAIGIGFWLFKPNSTAVPPPAGQISAAPPSPSTPATPTAPSAGATPSGSPASDTADPSAPGSPSAPTGPAALPAGAPLAPNLILVPMRTEDDDEDARPLYLVDSNGGADPTPLPGPDGKLANPMLQKDRTSIIFLEGGVLHVMASDGNDERDLADREPAGCENVAGASWSQGDASTMVIACRLSKNNFQMLVVDTNGRLIRRLDAGEKRFDDVTISPDGQTVLYWASDSTVGDGGSLFTLPLVGTGAPKQITSDASGLDGDPCWSPDGSQIAFRRLVGGVGGNADVYVMNADGSGQRAVAETEASDIKPTWSPDGKNLLIVSNRKSAFGNAGKTWDLWLTRLSDGEVLGNLDLEADEITTPTWTFR